MTEKLVAGIEFNHGSASFTEAWLAVGRIDGSGVEIKDLHKVGTHRLGIELHGLSGLTAAGLDFPFALPADFVRFACRKAEKEPFQSWQEVVEYFMFMTFEDLVQLAGAFTPEPKRLCDSAYQWSAQSPLKQENPSRIHMTHQGMKILAGLEPAKYAVLPFQEWEPGKCAILEVFPGGTLWCLGLNDLSYQNMQGQNQPKMQEARGRILDELLELRQRKGITCKDYPSLHLDKKLQDLVIESSNAFDALIACYTTAVWTQAPGLYADPWSLDNEDVLLEGWIYAPVKTHVQ